MVSSEAYGHVALGALLQLQACVHVSAFQFQRAIFRMPTRHERRRLTAGIGEPGQFAEAQSSNGTHSIASVQEQLALFVAMSKPYFVETQEAKWLLAGVVLLTLLNSGVSVAFSYLSRDFWCVSSIPLPRFKFTSSHVAL
jgi:hypothetical protein